MPLPDGYVHSLAISTLRGRQRNLVGIRHQSFVDVITADDNGYLTTTAGPNAATISPALVGALVTAGVGIPDLPRNVVITVTHATSVVAESGVISGYDINDQALEEAWSVTATGTSKVFTGKKAFKRVTGVSIIAATDASANSNIVGTGVVLGLDTICSAPVFVAELEDGAAPTAGTLVAGNPSASTDRFGTYTPNSAPDDALDFDIWYLSDNPQQSD